MTHRLCTFGAALVLVITNAAIGTAQERAATPTAGAQEAKPAPGLGQGVKVHGRWVIDIRNPDGTLASHHEFDNALVTAAQVAGNSILAGFLGRRFTSVGDWHVLLVGENPPCGTESSRSACDITEPTYPTPASWHFRTLSINMPMRTETFPAIGSVQVPVGTLELSGQATASVAGAISGVMTRLGLCNPGTNCFLLGAFTSHALAAPIAVAAGQIIQVRVVFSFS